MSRARVWVWGLLIVGLLGALWWGGRPPSLEPSNSARARVSMISRARSLSLKKLSSVPKKYRWPYSVLSRCISSAIRSGLLVRN